MRVKCPKPCAAMYTAICRGGETCDIEEENELYSGQECRGNFNGFRRGNQW